MTENKHDVVIGGFSLNTGQETDLKDRKPITVWVPRTVKEKYRKAQETSHGTYIDHLRALIIADVELTDLSSAG